MKLYLQQKKNDFLFIPLILFLITIPLIMRDFTPRDELKYIDISNTMIKTHNFFVQYFNNELYTDKPPLYFWIIIVSRYIFGGFYTYGIVVFNIIIESFMLIKLYNFLKKQLNYKASITIIFLIITSTLHYISIVVVRMDVFLNSFIVLSLINFFDCYSNNNYKNMYKSYIYIGFAFLFKGLVGILTPMLVIIFFKFISKTKYTFKQINLLNGIIIIFLFILFWLIPTYYIVGSDFINELFFKQVYGRAVNAYIHKEPFYYYIFMLPIIIFPWNIAFFYSLYKSITNKSKTDLDKFLLLWIGTTLLYLSIIESKIIIYLLPITVPLLIITYIELNKTNEKIKNIILFITIFQFFILFIASFFIKSVDFIPFKNSIILSLFLIISIITIFTIKKNFKIAFYFSGSLIIMIAICLGLNMNSFNDEVGFYKYKNIIEKYVPKNHQIYTLNDDLLRTQFMIPNRIISAKDNSNFRSGSIIFLKNKNLSDIKLNYIIIYKNNKFCFIEIK